MQRRLKWEWFSEASKHTVDVWEELWNRSTVVNQGQLPGTKQCTWQRFIRAGCSHYSLRPEPSCWFPWCGPNLLQSLVWGWFTLPFLANKINHTQEQAQQQQQALRTKEEAKLHQEPNQQRGQTRKKKLIHVYIQYNTNVYTLKWLDK